MRALKDKIMACVKRRSKTKAYGEKQLKHILAVVIPLIFIGFFIEYGYYSTIGRFGQTIALQIVLEHFKKVITVSLFALVIDLLFAYIKGIRFKSISKFLKLIVSRPAVTYSLLFMLTFSYDVPMSALLLGTIGIVLCSQNTKIGYSYYPVHPVLVGYMIALFGILISNNKLGIYEMPLALSAPFMKINNGPILFTFEQFQLEFYSISTIFVGLFEASLSYILFLPMLFSGFFLIRRGVIDYKVSGLYLLIYIVLSLSYYQGASFETWVFPLQLLNGSILLTGIYLISDIITLPSRTIYKYLYIILTAVLSFILTYYVHFVFGAYMALIISQISVFLIRVISVNIVPSIKVQLIKSS